MNIDKILSFWSSHNTTIIESLVVVILVLVLILAYISFFSGPESESNDEGSLKISGRDLSQVLSTVLQMQAPAGSGSLQVNRTGIASDASSAGAGSGISTTVGQGGAVTVSGSSAEKGDTASVDVSGYLSEIERTKAEIAQREQMIADLKVQLQRSQGDLAKAAQSAVTPGEVPEEIKRKLSELEQKLSEYEIISEDIADLSKYKEENNRLLQELQRLKQGQLSAVGGTAAPAMPAPTPQASTPSAQAVAPVGTPQSSSGPEDTATAPLAPSAETAPAGDVTSANDFIGDDLMKEFEAAVANQKTGSLKG